MAKFEEGDERWIVKDREDGRNCNNWHWTTKDVSAHTKNALAAALQATAFDAPLAGCAIKSAEVKGEASVNNRKGRVFLIYEFEIKLKWEGDLRDADGAALESSKGSMRLPDVSAECLDDLEVEYSCKAAGGRLSEAMRKQGVACVRRKVEETMLSLQEELRAQQQQPQPQKTVAKPPVPQPMKIASAPAVAAPAAAAAARPPSTTASVAYEEQPEAGEHESEELPAALAAVLKKAREDPARLKSVILSNCSIRDCHLQPLIEALHHSQCAVEELDLAFNRITDSGVHVICKAISAGCAMELTHLYLGGNRTSVAGMAISQNLKQVRSDLHVDWKLQLRNAASMCTVGTVYAGSPAAKAGLVMGDSLIAFGPLQGSDFKSVSDSIVPLVKAHVNKEIDIVVVRIDQSGQVKQFALSLVPKQWSGGGLLGCILK